MSLIQKIENDHSEMVARLIKPGASIHNEMTPFRFATLLHSLSQFVIAGNRLDIAKKCVFNNKPMQDVEIPEEFGAYSVANREFPYLQADKLAIAHAIVGIATEASELCEAILHNLAGEVLDFENVKEELGDLEFYMEALRERCMYTRADTLHANLHKLLTGEKARYSKGTYSDEQANARADKAGEEAK